MLFEIILVIILSYHLISWAIYQFQTGSFSVFSSKKGAFLRFKEIIILKDSEAGNHFRSHSSSALDKKREEFFLDRNFCLFSISKGEKSSQFKQRLASRALD